MFCTKCGKENSDGAKFCTGCIEPTTPVGPAAPVETPVTPVAPAPQQPKKKIGLIIGIVVAAVVISIVVASLFAIGVFEGDSSFSSNNNKDKEGKNQSNVNSTTMVESLSGIEGYWESDEGGCIITSDMGVDYEQYYKNKIKFENGKVTGVETYTCSVSENEYVEQAFEYLKDEYDTLEEQENFASCYGCSTMEEALRYRYNTYIAYTNEYEYYYYIDCTADEYAEGFADITGTIYFWEEGQSQQEAIENGYYSEFWMRETPVNENDILALYTKVGVFGQGYSRK